MLAIVAVAVTLGVGAALPTGPAGAQEEGARDDGARDDGARDDGAQNDAAGPRPPLAELRPLHPALGDVAVSSPAYDRARSDVRAAREAEAAAKRARTRAASRLDDLRATERRLNADLLRAEARAAEARRRIELHRTELRELAVGYYVAGRGDVDSVLRDLDVESRNDAGSQRVLTESVNRRKVAGLRAARTDLARAETDIELTTAALEGVRADIVETTADRVDAEAAIARSDEKLVAASKRVDDERRLATVDAVELPMVVMDAYIKAAQGMSALAPGCGIPWWALAGVGQTESGHGTFGGARVRADGSLTRPIRGVALTGDDGTARITDTDGGRYDGDPVLDRAVGPMQFIPSTWSRWGTDGNGDGRADPQNLYDAATAAAAYLCASGPMRDADDQRRGFFSYNHSFAYVETVLGRAQRYASLLALES